MKKSLTLNFVSVLLVSIFAVQGCNSDKLIPPTNYPELIKLNLEAKVTPSIEPLEKIDMDKMINPEPSQSPPNSVIPKTSETPVSTMTVDTKTPAPIVSVAPVKKSYVIPIPINLGKITAYLTYTTDTSGKILVNLQDVIDKPTKLQLLDQHGNNVINSSTINFNRSGNIVSNFSKQADQKIYKVHVFFDNGTSTGNSVNDGFLSTESIPTPIDPLPTPVPTPELPTNYPQTFIPPTPILNTGIITTIAGNDYVVGMGIGDGGLATNTILYTAAGVAVARSGNIYVSETINNRIRKIDATTGIITTIAGDSTTFTGNGSFSGDGGLAVNAFLYRPSGVAVDSLENIYVADTMNNRIRKINAVTGIITTIAGNGTSGFSGDGGLATNALLSTPFGVAIDSLDNIYIADTNNRRIRKIDATTGIITTIASGIFSMDLAVDSLVNIYSLDMDTNKIKKIDAVTGIITTIAGNGTSGFSGDGGLATNASLSPMYCGVAVDKLGNIYVADSNNYRIRKIDAVTGIITTIAGNGIVGYMGDGGLAIKASFVLPYAIEIDSLGNIFVTDYYQRVRKITPN